MESRPVYYKWFTKIVSICIDIFFVLSVISSLFVFTSFINGVWKYLLFMLIFAAYICIMYFYKDRIRKLINEAIRVFDSLDSKKMILIIVFTSLFAKIIYTNLFYFDSTQGGDISIYNEIANQIVATGELKSSAISHLFGLAAHLALMKTIGMPLHFGTYIAILTGTLFNFVSASRIFGKSRSFLATMTFILMPSTCFLSMCITHEIFVYLYLSIFVFLINSFLRSTDARKTIILSLLLVIDIILTCIVNPAGYIIYVILMLLVLLSNLGNAKKVCLIFVLLFSILGSKAIDKLIDVNEYETTINTYSILIHGSNIGSMGEQQDGFPHMKMREYLTENGMEFNHDNFKIAARAVLFNQYKYLLSHPFDLLRIIVHKIYIQWSGVHYPIELAYVYKSIGIVLYCIILGLNSLIYLFALSIKMIFRKKTEDQIDIVNYKLAILGVLAITMLSVVLNKYLLYITLFIYIVSINETNEVMEND